MAEVTALEAANALLAISQADDEYITNLKLQKLLYYAQGWFLADHGRPLFDEPIEAWVRGPVVPSVYRAFKRFTWQPIAPEAEPTEVPPHVFQHLQEVWDGYGRYTGRDLERMTHCEPPWLLARQGLRPDDPSNRPIEPSVMRDFFSREAAEVARQDVARAQA